MFSYIKLFSFISLAFVVIITLAAGMYFRVVAVDYLTQQLIEKNNISAAQGYIETVWRDDGSVVATIKDKSAEQLKTDQKIIHFAQETIGYFKKMPIMRVNVYGSSGTLILSSDVGTGNLLAADNQSPDTDFIAKQFNKTSASNQIIKSASLKNGGKSSILQTIVPIILSQNAAPDGMPEGMLEIVTDLGEPLEKLTSAQIITSIYIIGIFLAFLGLLLVMAKRAEAIISKQHEINIELAAAADNAQNESRDKSQFLANVSHELRTPLNSIIGFSEIIQNNVMAEMDTQKFEGYINDIHTSGVHLLSLINDILDFSKAEAGKLELEVAEVNANKLVHNCLRLVAARAETAQVKLVEALPKETMNIVTDSKKFKQIMLNLLSNAIKFTPQGGEVRISAWVDMSEKSFVFEVKDSGIGIAPKDISRAMSPFGQVDSTLSRKYEGTGLGLPLTKKFVEIMGGKFTITSEVGEGTTITFSLPHDVSQKEGVMIKQAI